MKDTWLKLHTSFLLSAKLTNLDNQKDCWAFVVIMALTKKGLITKKDGITPSVYPLLRGLLKTNQRGLVSTTARLKLAELLDKNGYPIGFEESQLTPSAIRMRRKRGRHSDGFFDGRKQKAEEESQNPLGDFGSSFSNSTGYDDGPEITDADRKEVADYLASLRKETDDAQD